MAFTTTCTLKGCGQLMQPYLDPQTDKVHCSSCDGEMSQITSFVKQQLKMNKQYRPKKTVAFAVKCTKCGKEDRPLLMNDDVYCPSCKSPHSHLSTPFKLMLKEKLKTVGKDV